MSKKKKSDKSAPMPAQGAGLLRFFEEETEGIRVKPELLAIFTAAFIVICILLQLHFLGKLPF